MSGYKRVNFYELCRLCATNQQKEKTHIFQEEGRKIQLQSKIQSCLSLKVCENDFLPKVVCSQCLRTLEECFTFRTECVTSETMLSSYFNNFRYTEDFKRSGKVYIKDVAPKPPQTSEFVTNNVSTNTPSTINNSNFDVSQKCHEQLLTVQVPPQNVNEHKVPVKNEMQKLPSSVAYNLNPINFAAFKGIMQNIPKCESVSNIAVNANGEIINITPLLDLESILMQNASHKSPKQMPNAKTNPKRFKIENVRNDNVVIDGNVIQIDLNQSSNNDMKYEKSPHIKSTHNNKYTYTIKIDDGSKCSNQAIVVNQVPNVNLPVSTNQGTFNQAVSQNNTTVPGGNINSTLSVGNSLNNWSFAANSVRNAGTNMNTSAHLCAPSLTSTTSNITVTPNVVTSSNMIAVSNMTTPSNMTVSSNASSVAHIPAAANLTALNSMTAPTSSVSNISSASHIHLASNSVSTNSSLGQVNSSIVSSSGLHFPTTASANNTAWNTDVATNVTNVNTSTDNLNASNNNLNCSGTFGQHQNFQVNSSNKSNSNMFSKKNRINIMSNAIVSPAISNVPVQTVSPVKQEQTQSKLFPCDNCQKVFKRREHLYQHIKLHTGFRPFMCENCNKSFMRKEHLMRHMTSHSGLKNYMCNLCSKSFSRNDNLLKHKKTHDKQTSFTCEICQKQFVMKHYYLAHKLTHENEKCPVPLWNILKA